eukprot:g3035.t1
MVFRLDAVFKRGLRTKEYPTPSEAPLVDVNYVVIGRNVGLTRDQARLAIDKMLQQIGRLARIGRRLKIELPGIGVLYANRTLVGFRFLQPDALDMFKQDPDAARNRAVLNSMSATAAQYQNQSNVKDYQLEGASAVANLEASGGADALERELQRTAPGQDKATKLADFLEKASGNADGPAVDEENSGGHTLTAESLLQAARTRRADAEMNGAGEEHQLRQRSRDRREKKSKKKKRERRRGNIGGLLNKFESNIEKVSKSSKPEHYHASNLPRFLVPEHEPYAKTRLEKMSGLRDYAVKIAHDRHKSQLQAERRKLERHGSEIDERRKRSENAHRSKMALERRRKQENRKYIIEQARIKAEIDAQREDARRFMTDPDPSRCMPMAVEMTAKQKRAGARVQRNLRRALDKQVRDKKRRAKREREREISEQRMFLECVHKQLVDDRIQRRQKLRDTQKMLREQWAQQQELERVRNDLLEARHH